MFVLTRAVERWIRLLAAEPYGSPAGRSAGAAGRDGRTGGPTRVSFWELDVSLWRVAALLAGVILAFAPLLVLILLLTRLAAL